MSSSSDSSDSGWWWLLGVVVAIALAIGGVLLWRNREARARKWRDELARTLPDVRLARDLLDGVPAEPIDPARLEALRSQVGGRAAMLDLVAASAPNGDNRSAAAATALSLRNLMRAIEAEQLLVTDPASAGPDAVAAAGATRVAHADALDDALTKLESAASTGPITAPTADATRPSDSA